MIDDLAGKTITAASSRDKDISKKTAYGGNRDAAAAVGRALAARAQAAGIQSAAFDRGHCKYHGRVAALADAIREAGLQF